MNQYTFDQIELGMKVSFLYEITKEKMEQFLSISGDENPLHANLEYAKEQGHDEVVVYGMLSSAILSTLAGMYLPGKHSLIHCVEIHFLKPVFLSLCPLEVEATVIEKEERFSQITLKYCMRDQHHDKVARGTMKIGVTA